MNHVERFRAVMNFQPVDRLPRVEWATWWGQTIDRWRGEGLPGTLRTPQEICAHFGLDPYWQHWFSPRAETFPQVEHGQGVVASHEDYDRIKPHLFPPIHGLLEKLAQWGQAQARGEAVVWITLEGFFWFPRTLLGIENHFYAFYDHPDLMHRMLDDLLVYHLDILRQLAGICRPTFMTFGEDMSYNHGPMLSKPLFTEFLAPYYRQIIPVLRDLGIMPIVDSDGDVAELFGWLDEVGVVGILPLERQAGCCAAALRQKYPNIRMIGHFDKMTMPLGEPAMRAEFERLLPVMKSGGFIPSVDHQTPPGVSMDQYRTYLRLLTEYTER